MGNGPRLTFTKVVVDDLDVQCDFYGVSLGMTALRWQSGGEGEGEFEQVVLAGSHLFVIQRLPLKKHLAGQPA